MTDDRADDDRDLEEILSSALEVGIADVKDAFHRMLIPGRFRRLFGLPPLPAEVLGLVGQVLDGHLLREGDLVYPVPAALPMGCSWSLYFAQRAVQNTV